MTQQECSKLKDDAYIPPYMHLAEEMAEESSVQIEPDDLVKRSVHFLGRNIAGVHATKDCLVDHKVDFLPKRHHERAGQHSQSVNTYLIQ